MNSANIIAPARLVRNMMTLSLIPTDVTIAGLKSTVLLLQ